METAEKKPDPELEARSIKIDRLFRKIVAELLDEYCASPGVNSKTIQANQEAAFLLQSVCDMIFVTAAAQAYFVAILNKIGLESDALLAALHGAQTGMTVFAQSGSKARVEDLQVLKDAKKA